MLVLDSSLRMRLGMRSRFGSSSIETNSQMYCSHRNLSAIRMVISFRTAYCGWNYLYATGLDNDRQLYLTSPKLFGKSDGPLSSRRTDAESI